MIASSGHARLDLPLGVAAVGRARKFAAEMLWSWDATPALVSSVEVLVSELVTNAVIYGSGVSWVSLQADADCVTISVADRNTALPIRREPSDDAESGRGLALVTALSESWGVEPHEGGKVVWARVPVLQ